MAQKTQTGALYQPRGVQWGGRGEGSSKGTGYMCTYGQFMLRFDRKQQSSIKQFSSVQWLSSIDKCLNIFPLSLYRLVFLSFMLLFAQ